jgi:hypothetical protein
MNNLVVELTMRELLSIISEVIDIMYCDLISSTGKITVVGNSTENKLETLRYCHNTIQELNEKWY